MSSNAGMPFRLSGKATERAVVLLAVAAVASLLPVDARGGQILQQVDH